MKRKKKSGHKKSHKIYALVVLLLGLAIIALAVILLFYVQKIEVKGNEYTSSEEIVKMVEEDKGSFNSLYILWKYHFTDYKKPDSVQDMQVSLKAPWIVRVKVKEKPIMGCAVAEKSYVFFDSSGEVVWESTQPIENIVTVEGLDAGSAKKGDVLSKGRERLFKELDALTSDMGNFELSPDKIVCDGNQMYVYFGDVCVAVGSSVTTEKISQIPPILEKLGGQKGTLHLEYFENESSVITFDKEELPQTDQADAGQQSQDEGQETTDDETGAEENE